MAEKPRALNDEKFTQREVRGEEGWLERNWPILKTVQEAGEAFKTLSTDGTGAAAGHIHSTSVISCGFEMGTSLRANSQVFDPWLVTPTTLIRLGSKLWGYELCHGQDGL